MNATEVFPPHGFVRLIDHMGGDLDVVNAARVSFHKESKWEANRTLSKQDAGLLRFLLKNKHGTPFEQGFQSMWHIRLPIFVMREWVRHRIGHSLNEESGRYVEMRPDFYYPEQYRRQVGKPGNYSYEPIEGDLLLKGYSAQEHLENQVQVSTRHSWDTYQNLLSLGVAKEQARIVLPLNLYTEIRWTANARSLMNFLALRNADDAMFEIRQYAEALESFFAWHMPVTYNAFLEAGRVAP